jgi:hypothetical protein
LTLIAAFGTKIDQNNGTKRARDIFVIRLSFVPQETSEGKRGGG